MASELRVNTLKDASGNNSVAMSTVAGASNKAWNSIDGTGTLAIRDSFNVSSVSDDGTGDYRTTFTSAMVNDDYACPLGSAVSNDFVDNTDIATTAVTVKLFNLAASQVDNDPATFSIVGDLA